MKETRIQRLLDACDRWHGSKKHLAMNATGELTVSTRNLAEFQKAFDSCSGQAIEALGIESRERLESMIEILVNAKQLLESRGKAHALVVPNGHRVIEHG